MAAGRVPAGSTLACEIEGEIAEILVDHGHYQRALPYLAAARASESETAEQSRHLAELEAAMQDKTTNPERAVTNRPLPLDLEKILDQNQARLSGRIHNYFSKRGYGFIEANPGSGKLFFHISQCEFADGQEAQPGLRVSFVIGQTNATGVSRPSRFG